MDTKLALKLDKAQIEKAKGYASKRKTSFSSLVEKYFAFLADIDFDNTIELTPTFKKLSGVLRLDADFK